MNRPRRKQFNPINAPALARWILITGFLAVTGLIYVYLSVQLYHLGDRKKALENELTQLHSESSIAAAQIAELTSPNVLQRRLKEGYLKMVPIAEANIVRFSASQNTRNARIASPTDNKIAGR
jgi:hypothetical protein